MNLAQIFDAEFESEIKISQFGPGFFWGGAFHAYWDMNPAGLAE